MRKDKKWIVWVGNYEWKLIETLFFDYLEMIEYILFVSVKHNEDRCSK